MKPAVLFDLGNTLAAYYHSEEFTPILRIAVRDLWSELDSRGLAHVPLDAAFTSAVAENREAADFRLIPIDERLERIFEISLDDDPVLAECLAAIFLRPIFDVGRVYGDSIPTMRALRDAGHSLAIVSNAPWGSPPNLWRQELARLGLASAVDAIVLCGDVGWRKPAPAIFRHAASALDRRPDECIFVGDDLNWDLAGSESVGMRPVLIDRDRRHPSYRGERIAGLDELSAVIRGPSPGGPRGRR